MNLAYPYGFDARRRTAEAGDERHIRDLVEQVLFTQPGERVMRPTFGSGVMQLVFAPNSPELAGATQMLVQGALTQWLGALIAVQDVTVLAQESTLQVTVRYVVRRTGEQQVQVFTQAAGGAP
jgi:hypothetical protein